MNALDEAGRLFGDRRYRESAVLLRQIVAVSPSVPVLRGLGECALAIGELDEAYLWFSRALELAPADIESLLGLADVALWRDGRDGWCRIIDHALALPILPPPAFHFLIRKACLHWSERRTELCSAILVFLARELHREGEPLARLLQGYTMSMGGHLQGLLRGEAQGRAGHYDAQARASIFLIGDSHCLGPAASLVPIAGELRRVVPLYVLGCKAWHLANPERNQYKACVERLAAQLPEGAHVIFSAGDIDCRYRSGFYNLWHKAKADLDQAIDATICGYVDYLGQIFGSDKRVMLLAPPAPRPDLHRLEPDDKALLASIAARFHDRLTARCAARTIDLVDYYRLTVGEDGWSHGRHHADGHHLYADALRLALTAS